MTKKIFIAIPTFTGEVHHLTMMAVGHAQKAARDLGWQCEFAIRANDSILTRARNVMLTAFMATDATDLLFWDADIAIEPETFVRLCSHEADIVAGVYRARSDPERYVYRDLPGSTMKPDDRGLVEVEGVATGLLRITRAAVERLVETNPDLWCHDRQLPGVKVLWFFDFERVGHDYFGEDFTFCRRWRAAGGKIFIDPSLRILHTGTKTFDGNLADFLMRRAAATAPQAKLDEAHRMLAEAARTDLLAGGVRLLAAE